MCACMCIGNLLIALILRHMHGHARLVSAALQCCFLLSLPALSLSLSLLLFLYLFLPSIHSEYSCAAVNGFIEFAAGCCCSCCLAPPLDIHIYFYSYFSSSLLIVLHTRNVCACVRASVCVRVLIRRKKVTLAKTKSSLKYFSFHFVGSAYAGNADHS